MTEKSTSIKLNMIMNTLLNISSIVFPIITFPYVSRILLPEGTGKVQFVAAIISYFAMFAQLGIPTYGVRACAKVRDDRLALSKIVHELMIINVIMMLLTYVAFGACLAFIPKFTQEKNLFLIMSLSIVLNSFGVEWLYKALEQYTYITIRAFIFKLIALVLMFLFVKNRSDYVLYGGITIFASSASNILNFIRLRHYIDFKFLGDYQLKKHLKNIMVFFSLTIATSIYTNLDNVMLGFMKGEVEVGYYGAAVKIKMLLLGLVTSASAVLLPRASYYVDKGMKDELFDILQKTLHFVIMITLPFTIYFITFAEECILLLAGESYRQSITSMQVIMPTIIFIGITNIIGIQMMVPLGKEKLVLNSVIAGAVVDLLLNIIFIPKYGALGAAIGTLAAEIVVLIYQCIIIHDLKIKIFAGIPYHKIVFATFCGFVSTILLKMTNMDNLITLIVSAICFFVICGIVLIGTKDTLVKDLCQTLKNKINKIK